MPNNKPKKWIAAVLGLLSPPVGLLYAAHARAALAYFALSILVGVLGFLSQAWKLPVNAAALVLMIAGASHAYRRAKHYPDAKPRPGYSRWYGILGVVACVITAVLVFRAFFFEPFRAPSSSMLPTIPAGTSLIVQKWGYGNYGTFGKTFLRTTISSPLSRGDLIVFEFPEDRSVVFVKRLVGLPGDRIAYRGKRLFINGEAVPLRPAGDYFDPESKRTIPQFVETLPDSEHAVLIGEQPFFLRPDSKFPFAEKCTHTVDEMACEVPPGHFFTLGDHRDNSRDSRMWGFLPADHIVGKVVFVGS